MSAQKLSVPSEKSSWHYEMHFWKREKEWSNLYKQVFRSKENAKFVSLLWKLINQECLH